MRGFMTDGAQNARWILCMMVESGQRTGMLERYESADGPPSWLEDTPPRVMGTYGDDGDELMEEEEQGQEEEAEEELIEV